MRHGFSLVELSIVLVILGLLTGGILAGRSLIRASEIRAISTRLDSYRTATHSFRDKYFLLPGDITNATAFFGAASGGCPSGARSGTQTCNGNGDGKIGNSGNGNGFTDANESFLFWQHLANAGLIAGSYTGMGTIYSFGSTAPGQDGFGASGYGMYHLGSFTDGGYYQANYGNLLYFGTLAAGTSYPPIGAILKSEEMWNLDTKMDDGQPTYGKIITMKSAWNSGCTSSDSSGATYNLTTSAAACSILFIGGF